MSEEIKNTAPAQEAEQPETAPEETTEPAAAPEQEAAADEKAEPKDDKKKDGWFNKKARELEAVKAQLDAAEANAAQAKDQLLRMAAELDLIPLALATACADSYRELRRLQHRQRLNDLQSRVPLAEAEAARRPVIALWRHVFGD